MSDTRSNPSPFTREEQAALRDLWTVYDRHFDHIQQATLVACQEDPALRDLIASTPAAQMEAEQVKSRELTRQAMEDGNWQPYLENLVEQGGIYARMGLPFGSWFVVVTAAQAVLLDLLFEAYLSEPARLRAASQVLNKWFYDITMAAIGEQYLGTRENVIRQQQDAIRELSTPVLPLRPGLILVPVIGVIDSNRARQLTEHLLGGIREHRAKVVVMDLTGVPAVDSAVANHLLQTVRAARLVGARSVVTGISTENAQILTRIGVDLSGLVTTSDLQGGIEQAEWMLQLNHEDTALVSEPEPLALTHHPVGIGRASSTQIG